jgi:hypothetical protein
MKNAEERIARSASEFVNLLDQAVFAADAYRMDVDLRTVKLESPARKDVDGHLPFGQRPSGFRYEPTDGTIRFLIAKHRQNVLPVSRRLAITGNGRDRSLVEAPVFRQLHMRRADPHLLGIGYSSHQRVPLISWSC